MTTQGRILLQHAGLQCSINQRMTRDSSYQIAYDFVDFWHKVYYLNMEKYLKIKRKKSVDHGP